MEQVYIFPIRLYDNMRILILLYIQKTQ